MISHYLSKRDFPIRDFLNELEKKELLFFMFLTSHKTEREVELIYRATENMDFFLNKYVTKMAKKFPKEELVHEIALQYEEPNITPLVYRNIYNHSFDSDSVIFNTKLLILERFTSMIFSKRLQKIQDDVLERKFEIEGDSLEEFQKRLTHLKKPILNSLGITSLLGRTDNALETYLDSPFAHQFRDMILYLLLEQFEEIDEIKRKEMRLTIHKNELTLKRKQEELQKKQESLVKVKEQNRQLHIELKQMKKEMKEGKGEKEHEMSQKFQAEIKEKENQLERVERELKQAKEKILDNQIQDKKIVELQNQLTKITNGEQEKTMELVNLKRKVQSLESKTIETILQEYIEKEGLNERLYQCIQPLVENYQNQLQKTEQPVMVETSKLEQKVGYCVIEDNTHYVVFPDSTRLEMKDIPKASYIGQWQFVKVEMDGTFKWSYGYKYDENERDYLIQEFGSVIYKNNEPYLMKAVWDTRKLENISSYVNLKENQVISVNGKGELLRFYRSFHHNADHYIASIQAKGHEAYYVLKVFPNGMLVRNIVSDIEEFKTFDLNGHEISEQQILCVEDNQVIHVYYSSKFYTFSHLYKKAEHGVVEIKNDMIFIRKLSGEVVIVNEIPDSREIEEGDIIIVDECNNFMTIKKEQAPLETTDERKKMYATPKVVSNKKGIKERIEVDKEVLLVGKITYENSYKMSFFKKGYRAEVIDGYDPWTKIKSALKGKDAVVVVTDFVSHDNMWKMKDEGLDIPVVFSEYDGANRIVEQVEALLSDSKAI